jgi:hypothetical protein
MYTLNIVYTFLCIKDFLYVYKFLLLTEKLKKIEET